MTVIDIPPMKASHSHSSIKLTPATPQPQNSQHHHMILHMHILVFKTKLISGSHLWWWSQNPNSVQLCQVLLPSCSAFSVWFDLRNQTNARFVLWIPVRAENITFCWAGFSTTTVEFDSKAQTLKRDVSLIKEQLFALKLNNYPVRKQQQTDTRTCSLHGCRPVTAHCHLSFPVIMHHLLLTVTASHGICLLQR